MAPCRAHGILERQKRDSSYAELIGSVDREAPYPELDETLYGQWMALFQQHFPGASKYTEDYFVVYYQNVSGKISDEQFSKACNKAMAGEFEFMPRAYQLIRLGQKLVKQQPPGLAALTSGEQQLMLTPG